MRTKKEKATGKMVKTLDRQYRGMTREKQDHMALLSHMEDQWKKKLNGVVAQLHAEHKKKTIKMKGQLDANEIKMVDDWCNNRDM